MTQNARTTKPQAEPEKPFWQEFEIMLNSDTLLNGGGLMDGSMCGESWKAFLQTVRGEALQRLGGYRQENYMGQGFRASSLQPYYETRKKIERDYVRSLVDLYCSAERAYKSLSG